MMKKIKWLIGQLKQPRILLLTIVLLGAAGVCMLMIMSTVSARPSFCVSCHNMKPEYESYTHGNLLAKKHADAGVTARSRRARCASSSRTSFSPPTSCRSTSTRRRW